MKEIKEGLTRKGITTSEVVLMPNKLPTLVQRSLPAAVRRLMDEVHDGAALWPNRRQNGQERRD